MAPEDLRSHRDWPDLPFSDWAETCATLHLWMQIVGKVRLAHAPMVNHWWQVAFYVTCRGLTTSPIPYDGRTFQIDFDFIDHNLTLRTSKGESETMALCPRTVADFYDEFMRRLRGLGLETRIWTMPVEIPDAIPFELDTEHASYDKFYVTRFWRILVQADRLLKRFRANFLGKASPVHFFWGSFDLAVTRFSGRRAPPHPGGVPRLPDAVAREAYSHEVSSAGFWPGGGPIDYPAFYSYAYPVPDGFALAAARPPPAFFSKELGEFILPYEAVRTAPDPERALMEFLQSTYDVAADLARWDRADLECSLGEPGKVRPV